MTKPMRRRTQAAAAVTLALAAIAPAAGRLRALPDASSPAAAGPATDLGARLAATYRAAFAEAAGDAGKAAGGGPAEARRLEAAKLTAEIATLDAQIAEPGLDPARREGLARSRAQLARLLAERQPGTAAAGGGR